MFRSPRGRRGARSSHLSSAVATLFPGNFAMVMATGIVSITARLHAIPVIPEMLFAINIIAFAILWVMTVARLIRYPALLLQDLTDRGKGAAFLTKVAATSILGSQIAVLTPFAGLSAVIWLGAIILWTILIYVFFMAMTVGGSKPALEESLNGTWLLTVVSTQSLCALGTTVADTFAKPGVAVYICICEFMLGGMFYVIFISIIIYRWMFLNVQPESLAPPYWINMGAAAITTLAGARLMLAADHYQILANISHFLYAFTMLFWATTTWWIPFLALVTIWRHLIHKIPMAYDRQYWSVVFPVGMYSAATETYAAAHGIDFLLPISWAFAWIAIGIWSLTALGLARHLLRMLRGA